MQNLCKTSYKVEQNEKTLSYHGIQFATKEIFDEYLKNHVAPRLLDLVYKEKQIQDITTSLRDTGFSINNIENELKQIFAPNFVVENWLIGEFLAEKLLEDLFEAYFFYNHMRDAKNPNAKQTGTDIIGFYKTNNSYCFLFGEVKTSNNINTPPAAVNKRHHGLKDQLKELCLPGNRTVHNLIQYMQAKTIGADDTSKKLFLEALKNYLNDNTNIKVFGCLVRDTEPNSKDLSSSAKNLLRHVQGETKAEFLAIYTNSKMSNESWINIVQEVLNASKQ